MAFVGDDFKYDLFISYCWCEDASEEVGGDSFVREWTRDLVGKLSTKLRIGLSSASRRPFSHFFDSRNMRNSGVPLSETLKDAVQSSAFILVLMSPYYCRSPWCLQELNWFAEQTARDGRSRDHFIIREIVPTPHMPDSGSSGIEWPAALLDQTGEPLLRGRRLYDPADNTPIEDPDEKAEAIRDLTREISEKLRGFHTQLQATKIERVAAAGSLHQLYLHRHEIPDVWYRTKEALDHVALVNPDHMDPELTDFNLLKSYNDRRRIALSNCQGMIVVRRDGADHIQPAVSAGFEDRKVLASSGIEIPWVLVDHAAGEPPAINPLFRLPRVVADGADWPQRVLKTLDLA